MRDRGTGTGGSGGNDGLKGWRLAVLAGCTALALTCPVRGHGMASPARPSYPDAVLRRLVVQARVTPGRARVEATLHYVPLPPKRWVTVRFSHPVPPSTLLTQPTLQHDDKPAACVLTSATEAAPRYVKTRQAYRGWQLARMRWRSDTKTPTTLKFNYTQELTPISGISTLELPLRYQRWGNQKFPDLVAVTIHLSGFKNLEEVTTNLAGGEVVHTGPGAAVVTWEGRSFPAMDPQYRIKCRTGNEPVQARYHPTGPGRGLFRLELAHPAPSRRRGTPLSLVVAIDRSQAMHSTGRIGAEGIVRRLLAGLATDDRFNLVLCGSTARCLFSHPVAPTAERMTQVMEALRATPPNGKVAFESLLDALQRHRDPRRRPRLVLVTGGGTLPYLRKVDRFLEGYANLPAPRPQLSLVGMHAARAWPFLERCARATGGTVYYYQRHLDHRRFADRVLAGCRKAPPTDLRIYLEGGRVERLFRVQPGPGDSRHSLVLQGQYRFCSRGRMTIEGRVDGRKVVWHTRAPYRRKGSTLDPTLWARARVHHLLLQIRYRNGSLGVLEELVRLVRRHGFATPWNNLLLDDLSPHTIYRRLFAELRRNPGPFNRPGRGSSGARRRDVVGHPDPAPVRQPQAPTVRARLGQSHAPPPANRLPASPRVPVSPRVPRR